MTDEEAALRSPSMGRYDRHTPLIYADWLRERGRELEADYWQELARMRQEIVERPVSCSMWMYSCCELASDWNVLRQMGCTNCVRWAIYNQTEEGLRRAAGITGGPL